MNNIQTFLDGARARGLSDDQIVEKLKESGWEEVDARAVLENDLVAPSPTDAFGKSDSALSNQPQQPIAVVQQYSTRGVEYGIMFFSLAFASISLGAVLHYLVDLMFGGSQANFGFESVALQAVTALITVPIFTVMIMRLRRAEKADPLVRNDPSRRKFIQSTLIIAFIWGIWALALGVYQLLIGHSLFDFSYETESVSDATFYIARTIHILITLAIAGSIFGYFWKDEHKNAH